MVAHGMGEFARTGRFPAGLILVATGHCGLLGLSRSGVYLGFSQSAHPGVEFGAIGERFHGNQVAQTTLLASSGGGSYLDAGTPGVDEDNLTPTNVQR